MKEITKIPGLNQISLDMFKLLEKKILLDCRLVNSSWKNVLDQPIFWLEKLKSGNRYVKGYQLSIVQDLDNNKDDLKEEFILILIKICNKKQIQLLDVFVELKKSKRIPALMKFLDQPKYFGWKNWSQWIETTKQ